MAGIIGYIGLTGSVPHRQKGLELLARLTPDGSTLETQLVTDWCAIGALAEPGGRHAPAPEDRAADGMSVLGCGEVYNTESGCICDAIDGPYRGGRMEELADLNGPFAAAVFDPEKHTVVLINDRYGLYPVYYYQDAECFCFSEKIRPLLRAGAATDLRKDALAEFLSFGFLPGDNTFFEHIHRVPPGSVVTISPEGASIRRYWRYAFNGIHDTRTEGELVEEMAGVLRNAVKRRIRNGESVVIPLSGGFDSRAILAAALECTPPENIVTFTFGKKGSWDADIGKRVAEKAGVRHISLGVEAEGFEEQYRRRFMDTEGMIDATPYYPVGGYLGMDEHGTRIFSGYLGGTITGANIPGTLANGQDAEITPESIARQQAVTDIGVVERLCAANAHTDVLASVDASMKDLSGGAAQHPADRYAIWDIMNRHGRYTPPAIFRNREIFRYATPFADNDYVDFMLSVPIRFRAGQYLYKKMLLATYPELYALPTKNNHGLPIDGSTAALALRRVTKVTMTAANILSTLLFRRTLFLNPGLNYLNYDDLLRTNREYRDFVGRMIERVRQRNLFDNEYLAGLWANHMRGLANHATLFGLLVTYELFLEEFVDTREEPGLPNRCPVPGDRWIGPSPPFRSGPFQVQSSAPTRSGSRPQTRMPPR